MSTTMTDTTADNGKVTKVQDVFYVGRWYQHLLDTQAFERGDGPEPVPEPVD
jgi:hypothetical protein